MLPRFYMHSTTESQIKRSESCLQFDPCLRVCWKWKNADIWHLLQADAISFSAAKKCRKIKKNNENRWK